MFQNISLYVSSYSNSKVMQYLKKNLKHIGYYSKECAAEPMDSEDPIFINFTSGMFSVAYILFLKIIFLRNFLKNLRVNWKAKGYSNSLYIGLLPIQNLIDLIAFFSSRSYAGWIFGRQYIFEYGLFPFSYEIPLRNQFKWDFILGYNRLR